MSSLWAVEAAKNSKKSEPVPGTSRFISAEMKNNLSVSRDGIQTLSSSLHQYVSGLNTFIDSINGGASYSALSSQLSDLVASAELPPVEDSSSRSYSLLKSELDISDGPPKPELNYTQSERIPKLDILLPSEHASRSASADPPAEEPQPSKHEPQFHIERDLDSSSDSSQTYVDGVQVKLEPPVYIKREPRTSTYLAHDPAPLDQIPVSSTPKSSRKSPLSKHSPPKVSPRRFSHSVFPPTSPQKSSPQLKSGNDAPNEEPTAFTPIHIPPAAAPTTSPNVDLSFIPIANTINPRKFDGSDSSEADEQSDNSFQAISTAIRKSFAGKLSMGNLNSATPLYKEKDRDDQKESPKNDVKVKLEHIESVRKKSITSTRPRSFHQPSHRSSIFVNLPSREPIAFNNNKKSAKNGNPKGKEIPPRSKESPPKPAESQRPQPASSLQNESSPAKSTIPRLFADNPFVNRVADAKPPSNDSRTSRPSKPITASPRNQFVDKIRKHTTTASGSPVRSFTKTASSGARAFSRARSRSPVKPMSSSSAISSRSPTKYSHRADVTGVKDSPTDYSAVNNNQPEDGKGDLISRLMAPTSSSAAKGMKTPQSKENILRNRFLTTTLNPEKPPSFGNGVNGQEKAQEASKNAVPDLKRRESQARPAVQAPRKYEGPSRPKQKITLSLNHKLDVKASTDLRSRQTTSPKKRDRGPEKPVSRASRTGKRPAELFDSNVAPRKRAFGNAVPLPAAARGKFVREAKEKEPAPKPHKEFVTPARNAPRSKSLVVMGASVSPGIAPDALPEIPSDDDVLRRTKYIKSWAETPEILRTMREKQAMDPVSVFGEVPVLRMEEVFERVVSGKSNGEKQP